MSILFNIGLFPSPNELIFRFVIVTTSAYMCVCANGARRWAAITGTAVVVPCLMSQFFCNSFEDRASCLSSKNCPILKEFH